LADLEDRALRLLQALDDDQKKVAIVAEKAPADIKSNSLKGEGGGLSTHPPTDTAEGIAFSKLSNDQKELLRSLIEAYAADMPHEIQQQWLKEIEGAGLESIQFAWTGPGDRNQPHGYTVQGPTFLIEFNNTQNNANHIHSLWRNTLGDFGLTVARK
jgi:hypothetical protein